MQQCKITIIDMFAPFASPLQGLSGLVRRVRSTFLHPISDLISAYNMSVNLTQADLPSDSAAIPAATPSALAEPEQLDLAGATDELEAAGYEGINWKHLPKHQRPFQVLKGAPSWIGNMAIVSRSGIHFGSAKPATSVPDRPFMTLSYLQNSLPAGLFKSGT